MAIFNSYVSHYQRVAYKIISFEAGDLVKQQKFDQIFHGFFNRRRPPQITSAMATSPWIYGDVSPNNMGGNSTY